MTYTGKDGASAETELMAGKEHPHSTPGCPPSLAALYSFGIDDMQCWGGWMEMGSS